MSKSDYVCENCGDEAYYDGRMGDGPVLVCECRHDKTFVNDGRGGYYIYRYKPVLRNSDNRTTKRHRD